MANGFGIFGKIPAAGDFIKANLPSDFIQVWDGWLQDSLVSSQAKLGAVWEDAYLSAPIWRFSIPAGAAGRHAVSGLLMASVDRVGRKYPLTIAATHRDIVPAFMHFANRVIFEKLENIALAALDDNAEREKLMADAQSCSLLEPLPRDFSGMSYAGDLPPVQVLAANRLQKEFSNCALWSAMLEGNHRLMLTHGLPDQKQALGLFDLDAAIWRANTPAPEMI